MDMKDIEKELREVNIPSPRARKRVDYSVRHVNLKIFVSKALAVMFILAILSLAIYVLINAKNLGIDMKAVAAICFVYIALGFYIALRLWNIDFIGWVSLFFVSLAGICLTALSAANNGIMIGTLPVIVACAVMLAALWWVRDLYRVYRFGDIFSPPR